MNPRYLLTVVGPTAIGKTALAIKLAQHYNCEILSCDSRQFFKEMEIGTAVPSQLELNAVPHHFIQNKSIHQTYTVGDFERDAILKLEELFLKNSFVVMVGGSGLYVDAVTKGLDYFPKVDAKIREELNKNYEKEGITYLQKRIQHLDPDYAVKVDLENPQRLMRALEVCIGSGKKYSSFLIKKENKRSFTTIKIGLEADREVLYSRINQRVDMMVAAGLLDEAIELYPHRYCNALQTVGYRELFEYLDGTSTLEFAIEEIKKNTRRFAKRQFTWFRRYPETIWFDFQYDSDAIIHSISSKIKI